MKIIIRTDSFERDYKKLPEKIKQKTKKALRLLATNPYHPSLRVKKTKGEVIKGYSDVFEGRITKDFRFLFLIRGDTFYLLRCGKHDDFF
ncbi:MAG: type II toxin-antitoxin system RelE/ParE family toxin [Candidatus Brocadiales bacterium]